LAEELASVEKREISIREILFTSDLSPKSERAFEHARFLAERFRAALTLYHVVEFPPQAYLRAIRGEAQEVLARTEEEARRRLKRRSAGLTIPHQVIVEREASSGQADIASPASRRAFPMASLLARSFEAEIVALHVCPPAIAARLVSVPGNAPAGVPSEDDVRRFLQPELDGLPVSAHVYVNGAPWYRIVQAAETEKIDLVFMSSQGHDSVRDEIIGSNTERVLRHAPCPVLVA
jgi:nucleotide-binding universal stress UspA family protein